MSHATVSDRGGAWAAANGGSRRALTVVAVWTALGFVLRIAAARNDLWLDEIWSLSLIARTSSAWDILFGLPYDNNHPLNSLWLALVGPGASPLAMRFASIVESTATIPIAAVLAGRRSPRHAWVGAAFVALSPLFVQFGSEARGYGGLILAAMSGLLFLDACLDACLDPRLDRRGNAWKRYGLLGVAVAFGTLAHPTMIVMSAALVATATVRLARSDEDPALRLALRRVAPIVGVVAAGTLPAACAWLVSLSHMPPHFGGLTPWSPTSFVLGLGRLTQATFGLPLADDLAWPATLVGMGAALVGLWLVPAERRVLPAIVIFGIPALQALLHVPNEEYARFHIVTGIGLSLLAIEATIAALQRSGIVRGAAFAFVAMTSLGQAVDLSRLVTFGRGHPSAIVTAMAQELGQEPAQKPTHVAVEQDWIVRETTLVLGWTASRRGQSVVVEPLACPGRTPWLIRVDQPGGTIAAPATIASPPDCATRYRLVDTQRAYGLSGFTWHLYHRVEP